MKHILILSLILLFPALLAAETIQQGRVVLQSSKGKGVPDVQIIAPKAIPVQTDKSGAFTLTYSGLSAGDWAGINAVYKKGYELVNADEVRNWVLSPKNELIIVMCPEGSLQEARERYYLSGETHYKKKYEETLAKLSKQKEQNQVSADKYWEDIQHAGKELDRALAQLNRLSERLSAVNTDELNKEEQKVWSLLEEGKFEEAIDAFEREQLKNELTRIIPSMKRYTDILLFAGGETNTAKARKNLRQIALIAPDDFEAQYDYAFFLKLRVDYPEALEYLDKAWLLAANDLQKAKVHRELGEIYGYIQDYNQSEEHHNKGYELFLSLARELSPVYYLKSAECLNYLGNLCYLHYKYQKGIEVLKRGLELIDLQPERDSYDYLYQKASLQGTLGAVYFRNIEYNTKQYVEETESNMVESASIWRELAKVNPHEINKVLTSGISNVGVFYMSIKKDYATAEKYYLEAVRLQEEVDRILPLTVRNNLSIMYRNLAILYTNTGNRELAFAYLDKTMAIDEEMVDHNHKAFAASQIATFNIYTGTLNIFKEFEKALEMALKVVSLVTPLAKENQSAYYVLMVNAYTRLMMSYTYNGKYAEAVKAIQPIRYLIEDKELFANNANLFMNPLNLVNMLNDPKMLSEEERDEEVKEIFEFVSHYIIKEG